MDKAADILPDRRYPPLEGAQNFRDLGGYPSADGRHVRWGVLFRSGSPAGLTDADWRSLTAAGPVQLCDLRTTRERDMSPFPWQQAAGTDYWTRDCESSFGELRELMTTPHQTAEAAAQAMRTGYRRLPFEQAPAYREIFRRLHDGALPLIFNCSAGKDRAGTSAALILRALGVSEEQIVEDYLLSNRATAALVMAARARPDSASILARQNPDVMAAVLACDPTYIASAMTAITERCGSFAAYLEQILGVGPDELTTIRDNLLE